MFYRLSIMQYKISNSSLCQILRDSSSRKNKLELILKNIRKSNSYNENQLLQIKNKLSNSFLPQYNRNWAKCSRTKDYFLKKCARFLDSELS